jgi:hypothetical protein
MNTLLRVFAEMMAGVNRRLRRESIEPFGDGFVATLWLTSAGRGRDRADYFSEGMKLVMNMVYGKR